MAILNQCEGTLAALWCDGDDSLTIVAVCNLQKRAGFSTRVVYVKQIRVAEQKSASFAACSRPCWTAASPSTRSTVLNHGSRYLITAMPLSCTLDSAALLKILLHATKYPASPINGVLLGTATGGTGSQPAEDATSSLGIVDAVPLFHTYLHLAMPLETALLQVLVSLDACSPAHRRIMRLRDPLQWHHALHRHWALGFRRSTPGRRAGACRCWGCTTRTSG